MVQVLVVKRFSDFPATTCLSTGLPFFSVSCLLFYRLSLLLSWVTAPFPLLFTLVLRELLPSLPPPPPPPPPLGSYPFSGNLTHSLPLVSHFLLVPASLLPIQPLVSASYHPLVPAYVLPGFSLQVPLLPLSCKRPFLSTVSF